MGLPRVWGRVGRVLSEETEKAAEHNVDKDNSSRIQDSLPSTTRLWYSHGPNWTIAYYTLLFSGAFGFYKLLWPMTASNNALAAL